MKYILLAMGTTDTSVIPTKFFSVENTQDGNWNTRGLSAYIALLLH